MSITSADGREPRTGINIIRLTDGSCVQAMVIYQHAGCYEATEVDYDLGRPRTEGATPLEALQELADRLNEEICEDGRARVVSPERVSDARFAKLVAGVQ